MTRRWLLRDTRTGSPQQVEELHLFERLLAARGLYESAAITRFCEPKLTDLHNPATLPGIGAAIERLTFAIRNNQSIVIYGDYDVDGITATTILYHTILTAEPTAKIRSYVPHRLEQGYGLNADALRELHDQGADLVISVDCGITAVEPAAVARDIGLDLIITDHHNPRSDGALPDALAVVHPGLDGSQYPFTDLCGAGVAFKMAWQFATTWCGTENVSKSLQKTLLDMLPLAAMGAIADVVPLVGENRIIATYGLRWIKQSPIPGLAALIEESNLADAKIDSEKVGFILAPRLNACGRMGHAAAAVKMLTDASQQEARDIARRLAALNRQRQSIQRQIYQEATALAEDCGMTADDRRAIVLASDSWHPGVVGIVCSRLVERYGRPAILLQRNGELCKGSGRSVDGYSIFDGLNCCAQHLTTFGGHHAAAGLSLASDKLQCFTKAFIDHANSSLSVDELTPTITIDSNATLHEMSLETVKRLGCLSPFGRANPTPTVRVCSAVLADPPQQIGSNGKHLSLRLRQDEQGRRKVLRTVWWDAGHLAGDLAAGMTIDAALRPKLNGWNGRTTVEGELRDILIRG